MANIFDIDIKYITEQEVKDTTKNSSLSSLADADVKVLIGEAESIIDDYTWITPDLTVEEVAFDFKQATFYTVEMIFANQNSQYSNIQQDILEEKLWPRSVKFRDVNNTLKKINLNDKARFILDKYKKRFYKQAC